MIKSTEINKLVVISGCSGGGKSTLLSELGSNGYTVVAEVGREIVKEQLAVNGNITPWQNHKEFCEMLIARSIKAYKQAKETAIAKEHVIFFDRSFLEGVSYYQSLQIQDANKYDHYIEELRYYPTIFMAPPWKDIFRQDEERKQSFEDAVDEYRRLLKAYPEYGYRIIELPKASVKERVQFLLSSIL
jgi:predicted ATPase